MTYCELRDKLMERRLKRIGILLIVWLISQVIMYFILDFPNILIYLCFSTLFVFMWIIIDMGAGGLDDEIKIRRYR